MPTRLDPEAPEIPETTEANRRENLIFALAKAAVSKSLAGLPVNDEAIRIIQDIRSPKEVVSIISEQAERGKDELIRLLVQEISKGVAKLDLRKELHRFLNDFEIELTVRVNPRKSKKETNQTKQKATRAVKKRAPAKTRKTKPTLAKRS